MGRSGQTGFGLLVAGVIVACVVALAPVVRAAAPTVADLIALLGSDRSPKVRAQAALNLGAQDAPDDAAIDALLAGLKDEAPMVRGACAKALGSHPPLRAYRALAAAATDPDPFVAKWAGWAVRKVVATAPVVTVGLKKLTASAGPLSEKATKAFQEGVLGVVVAGKRFDIPSSFDFSDEAAGSGDDDDDGSADGEAAPAIHLEFEGELVERAGDPLQTTATVSMKAVCASGYAVWTGTASADGKGIAPPPPSEDDDEFTIRAEPVDALLPAVTAAGKAIARQFVESVDSKEWVKQ